MNFEDKLAESIASFQSALKEGDIVAANRQYCRVISYGANQEILAKFKMLYDQVFADEIERLRKEALSNQASLLLNAKQRVR